MKNVLRKFKLLKNQFGSILDMNNFFFKSCQGYQVLLIAYSINTVFFLPLECQIVLIKRSNPSVLYNHK